MGRYLRVVYVFCALNYLIIHIFCPGLVKPFYEQWSFAGLPGY